MRTIYSFAAILLFLSFVSGGVALAQEGARFSVEYPDPYAVGEEAEIEILFYTATPVLTAQVHYEFDPSVIAVKEVVPNEDLFPFWLEHTAEVQEGRGIIKLTAAIPTPGIEGEGTFATIAVERLAEGDAVLRNLPATLALNSENQSVLEYELMGLERPDFALEEPRRIISLEFAIYEREAVIGADVIVLLLGAFIGATTAILLLYVRSRLNENSEN